MIVRILSLSLLIFLVPVALAQSSEDYSVEELLAQGDVAYNRDDCLFAQYVYGLALEREPDNEEARLSLGRAFACQNAFDQAIEQYQKVIDAGTESAEPYILLAKVYEQQYAFDSSRYSDRLMDALEVLERAERLDSDNAQVYNTRGVIYYFLGNYEEAKNNLEKAISLAQGDFDDIDLAAMQVNLGKTYGRLGKTQLAQTALRRAVTLNPSSASAHNNLGWLTYQLGNCEDAIFELSQAVSLDPGSLDAVANLGIALFECDQVEAAIPHLQTAIDLGGLLLPPLYTYLARAYLQQGRVDDAVLEAQKGALLPPQSAEAYYWLGQAWQARGEGNDLESARGAYQNCLEINPNYSACQEALSSLP